MNSIWTGVLVLTCIFGGALIGLFIRARLPGHHLTEESRDVVKLGAGLIATLTALVLGLLISSAKDSFDKVNTSLAESGAKIIQLDRAMDAYGPQAQAVRDELRLSVMNAVVKFWPNERKKIEASNLSGKGPGLEGVQASLRSLAPQSDAQRSIQSQSIQLASDILQARWLMMERAQLALPPIFFMMLLSWLTILFACFGLMAPRNGTVIVVLFIAAISVTGAILLILEMSHPFVGIMKVSSAPIMEAFRHLGK
jgi:hypothetical protein